MWNHEAIHIEQQRELLVIPFFILYAWYFFVNRLYYYNNDIAYLAIPFEREAYAKEKEDDYLHYRPSFAWKKY